MALTVTGLRSCVKYDGVSISQCAELKTNE